MQEGKPIPPHQERMLLPQQIQMVLRVFGAEIVKQHQTFFGQSTTILSLLVWPVLQLATAYYTFAPFFDSGHFLQNWSQDQSPRSVLLFVAIGMLGYMFFWSLVQSAWIFSFERYSGTLELLFLTPVNRLVLVMGNGIGALVQNSWLFLTFVLGLILWMGDLHVAHPGMLIIAFVGLFIPALAWGTFLNCIFIFARDASFLVTLLADPMAFFSGVRLPLVIFPFAIQLVGSVLPLTTSLIVLRKILLEGATLSQIWMQLCWLLLLSTGLLITAVLLLRRGEMKARMNGTFSLF